MSDQNVEPCFYGEHDWWRQHLVTVRRIRPGFLAGQPDANRKWFRVEVCAACGWMRGEATYEDNTDGGQSVTTVMMVDHLDESEVEQLIPGLAA